MLVSLSESCPFLPNPQNSYSYIEMTVDRNFTRDCAPGTIYSKEHCICITDTNVTRIPEGLYSKLYLSNETVAFLHYLH